MELGFQTLVLLPAGLGLLGFVEPCTVGAHLLFLDTQSERSTPAKLAAIATFIAVRSLVTGGFGALIAFAGHVLIDVQSGMWLAFGLIYLAVGLAFLTGQAGPVKRKVSLAPETWKRARHPFVLGLAFGLNIPACAAPILFGLLGLAAGAGTVATGFTMMFLFGLFLSLPLVPFAVLPALGNRMKMFGQKMKQLRWPLAAIFILLGLWSVWFGLYVEPADWSGR